MGLSTALYTIDLGERCAKILNVPLEIAVSKKSSCLAKAVAVVAIVILSAISLGGYAIYTNWFMANKRLDNLLCKLANAITEGNGEQVQELFLKHPSLKKVPNDPSVPNGDTLISKLLPLAADKGHLKVVQLLCDNGAVIGTFGRGGKTALEYALNRGHSATAIYLLEKGATFTEDNFRKYLGEELSTFEMIHYLVNRIEKISSVGKRFSCIGMMASPSYWDKDPIKCQEIIRLLVQKGDRLTERDATIITSHSARTYLNNNL
jgi:hypothetical protein